MQKFTITYFFKAHSSQARVTETGTGNEKHWEILLLEHSHGDKFGASFHVVRDKENGNFVFEHAPRGENSFMFAVKKGLEEYLAEMAT
jgi:hypothetical protein